MLQRLYIKNFAIINELQQEWDHQLTTITGETGAGKSILLGAVELILGNRADHSVILNKDEKCIVEAQFNVPKSSKINTLLQERDFEVFDDLIIRREINPNGRSRSFINDTPAKLEDLSTIGHQLIDLHRQFDNYELLHRNEQLSIVDTYLLLNEERKNYTHTFSKYKSLKKDLETKLEESKNAKAEQDYLQFISDEIGALNLKENIIEDWETNLHLLENAQQIKEVLLSGAELLSNSDQSIIDALNSLHKEIQTYSESTKEIKDLSVRLQSTIEELKDISAELEIQECNINTDEEQLELITEKLESANKLLLKHSVKSTEELMSFHDAISDKLLTITNFDKDINELQQEVDVLEACAKAEAEKLSKKRLKGIKTFVNQLNELLPELGFINAKFEIQHSFKEIDITGIDDIEFRFDANNTGHLQPIIKAISGGEMSRVMLIIKYLMAHSAEMPCMIFDEIDTGISGEIALKVGNLLRELATKHQVISITHLPQIAAKAHHHLFVYKEVGGDKKQFTNIKKLQKKERVSAIAEMLSGNKDSTTAMKTASELLSMN